MLICMFVPTINIDLLLALKKALMIGDRRKHDSLPGSLIQVAGFVFSVAYLM